MVYLSTGLLNLSLICVGTMSDTGMPLEAYDDSDDEVGVIEEMNVGICRSTKTQVNLSSALNRTKHHQSNPSNVPGILDSNLSKRACIYS